jgi:intein/homing endonuclease
MEDIKFEIPQNCIEKYYDMPSPFGFNGLGEFVYMRTYSRVKDDGSMETWPDTVRRVVNGTYTMQKKHIIQYNLGWNEEKGLISALEMFDRIFHLKFTPPGRGLWTMGSDITNKKSLYAALNNCAMVTTANINTDYAKPFAFMMDMTMLGVGVGFDTEGKNKLIINQPIQTDVPNKNISEITQPYVTMLTNTIIEHAQKLDVEENEWVKNTLEQDIKKYTDELEYVKSLKSCHLYVIEDTREGWVESVSLIINSYLMQKRVPVVFDYHKIRPAGLILKTFGGVSSGPGPLLDLHTSIRIIFEKFINLPITSTIIVDVMNLIGKAVVAGNVRRCLPYDTLIHTTDGLIQIKDVRPGMKVVTSNGVHNINELINQGMQKVIKVNTSAGSFKCTDNHRIAVFDNNKYKFKCAKDLLRTDKLVFSRHLVEGKSTRLPECLFVNNINIPELNIETAWFLGYCLNHCYVSSVNYSTNINNYNLHINNLGGDAYYSRICAVLDSMLNEWCAIDNVFVCASSEFANYMISLFNLEGSSRRVPECIMNGNINIRAAFLAGYFDDYMLRNGTYVAQSAFKKCILDIQAVYASLGILTEYTVDNIYYLSIADKISADIFMKSIYNKYSSKRSDFSTYLYKKVEQSEVTYDIHPVGVINTIYRNEIVHTYDISVDTIHEFAFNFGLICHNSSQIALEHGNSDEFLNLKNYSINPERASWGWASNNSIVAELGMDYTEIAKRIADNGEPGLFWIENARNYSRMGHPPDYKDMRIVGTNPSLRRGTRVLTDRGILPIELLEKSAFKVKNLYGNWSPAECFLSGRDKKLYRIMLSDGHYYDATSEHRWPVFIDNKYKKVNTIDLKKGMKLPFMRSLKLTDTPQNSVEYEFGHTLGVNATSMPNEIWGASECMRKGFIEGVLTEHGEFTGTHVIIRSNYSNDLSELLGFYGIKSHINTSSGVSNGGNSSRYIGLSPNVHNTNQIGTTAKPVEVLCIVDNASLCHLANVFKLRNYAKQERLDFYKCFECSSMDNVTVMSLKELNIYEDVWDITVHDDTHCFQLGYCITGNCGEQPLCNMELCTLVETFPYKHTSKADFLRTLKFAYLYAKTVTLGQSHWPETNQVMLRNRRIGCSISGVTQFISKNGISMLKDWLNSGYDEIQKWDEIYSEWFGCMRSIKTTTCKPSGCLDPWKNIIKTDKGDLTITEIFELNGYNIKDYLNDSDKWFDTNTIIKVLNENNEYEPITKLYVNGINDVYEVPLEDGTVITCTPNHKFKLTDGTWKMAKDLCENDYICTV